MALYQDTKPGSFAIAEYEAKVKTGKLTSNSDVGISRTLAEMPRPAVTSYSTVATSADYGTLEAKATKLAKVEPASTAPNNSNDYHEIGCIHQHNLYADTMGSIIKGKDSSFAVRALRDTAKDTGYITEAIVQPGQGVEHSILRPLGYRVEHSILRPTGLDGRLYFWEKGVD